MITVGFQMDPLDNIDPRLDTSFRLAEEAELRGYSVFHYLPKNLTFSKTRIIANGHYVKLNRKQNPSFTILKNKNIDIGHDLDILWLRQDPPFNMDYLSSTYLLDFVGNETLIVNNPFWVRNFPEKLLVLNYPQLMPATIITSRIEVIQEFREKFGADLKGNFLFICKSGIRSNFAALTVEESYNSGNDVIRLFNIVDGFEGNTVSQEIDTKKNGWKFLGLPWKKPE